jgi:integrase
MGGLPSDLSEEGIFVHVSKTKNKLIIRWSEELKNLIENIKKLPRKDNHQYLFVNSHGNPYSSSGLQTMWQRFMHQAISEGILQERFRFHDIRRKSATDIEHQHNREAARKLLGHTDQKTTAIYISGVEKVNPLR